MDSPTLAAVHAGPSIDAVLLLAVLALPALDAVTHVVRGRVPGRHGGHVVARAVATTVVLVAVVH